MSAQDNEPLVAWTQIRKHISTISGNPPSIASLHRWRALGMFSTLKLGRNRYVRLSQALREIEAFGKGERNISP